MAKMLMGVWHGGSVKHQMRGSGGSGMAKWMVWPVQHSDGQTRLGGEPGCGPGVAPVAKNAGV